MKGELMDNGLYGAILNEIEDLVYILDPEGRVLSGNRALRERLGYTEAQLLRLSIADLHPAERSAEVDRAMAALIRTGAGGCAIPLVSREGETVSVESRLFRAEGSDGTVYVGICKDMTILRRTETLAMNTRAQLAAILDHLPFYSWMKDEKGRFIAISRQVEEVLGRPRAEILGRTDYEIWPEALAAKYVEDDRRVMASGKPLDVEELIIRGDRVEWIETCKAPIVDAEGRAIGTVGAARIVSEHRRLQQELKGQKRFLKALIDAIPDLIFYKDTESVYLGCNKAFSERFVGLPEEAIIGKTDFDLFEDHQLASFFRQKDREMLAAGAPAANEETVTLTDGTPVDIETIKTPSVMKKALWPGSSAYPGTSRPASSPNGPWNRPGWLRRRPAH